MAGSSAGEMIFSATSDPGGSVPRIRKNSHRFQRVGRGPPTKRGREGSVNDNVESLNSRKDSSTDMSDQEYDTPFMKTPRAQTKPKSFDLKVLIVPIDTKKSLRNTNLIRIAKDIQTVSGSSPEYIKPIRSGILVKCFHVKQYNLLLGIQTLGNTPVKAQKSIQKIRGVISGVPSEMSEEDILGELKRQKVVDVKRIKRKQQKKDEASVNTSEWIPTRSVIISFDNNILPEEVALCYQKFKVREYIPPVIRCYKCQRYGHVSHQCRSQNRCVRCSGPHTFEECTQKDVHKCANCGKNHSAAYNGCVEAKKAKEVQKIKVQSKISYAQAAKQLLEKGSEQTTPPIVQIQAPQASREQGAPPQHAPTPVVPPTVVEDRAPGPSEQIQRPFDILEKTPTVKPVKKNNFLTSASDEEVIQFIFNLASGFLEDRPQEDSLRIIRSVVDKLFYAVKRDGDDRPT